MDQFKQYLQFKKEVVESELKVIEQFQKGDRTRPKKTYVKD